MVQSHAYSADTPMGTIYEAKEMVSVKFSVVSDPLDDKTIKNIMAAEQKAAASQEAKTFACFDYDDIVEELADAKLLASML